MSSCGAHSASSGSPRALQAEPSSASSSSAASSLTEGAGPQHLAGSDHAANCSTSAPSAPRRIPPPMGTLFFLFSNPRAPRCASFPRPGEILHCRTGPGAPHSTGPAAQEGRDAAASPAWRTLEGSRGQRLCFWRGGLSLAATSTTSRGRLDGHPTCSTYCSKKKKNKVYLFVLERQTGI